MKEVQDRRQICNKLQSSISIHCLEISYVVEVFRHITVINGITHIYKLSVQTQAFATEAKIY